MENEQTAESAAGDIPNELKDLLIQFSVAYLVDRPHDIVDFAVEYFQNLQNDRNTEQESENRKMSSRIEINDESPNADHGIVKCRTTHLTGVVGTVEEELIKGDNLPPIHAKTEDEKNQIYKSIKEYAIFRPISKINLYQIIDYMSLRAVGPNEIVYKQDENGDIFYVVKSGTFEQYRNGNLMRSHDSGDGFGELALLYSAARSSTVKAVTAGELWQIDRWAFRKVLFHSEYQNRLQLEDLFDKICIFKQLSAEQKMNLADAVQERFFESGEVIYMQKDKADGMYFIQNGTVQLVKGDGTTNSFTIKLDEGEHFGEAGLFTGSLRACTATAVDKVHTAFLGIGAFNRLVGTSIVKE